MHYGWNNNPHLFLPSLVFVGVFVICVVGVLFAMVQIALRSGLWRDRPGFRDKARWPEQQRRVDVVLFAPEFAFYRKLFARSFAGAVLAMFALNLMFLLFGTPSA